MVVATALMIAAEAPAAPEEIKNPILPVSNEIFWGAVCFFALWALMKFVLLPPIVRAMDQREQKVRNDLDAAERAKVEAQTKVADYDASLASAKAEAVRIIEDARTQADADRKQVLAAAESDASAIKAAAAQEVNEAKAQARAQMGDSLADIAVSAAGAVVRKPLDRSAQLQTIEDYVNRAGSQS